MPRVSRSPPHPCIPDCVHLSLLWTLWDHHFFMGEWYLLPRIVPKNKGKMHGALLLRGVPGPPLPSPPRGASPAPLSCLPHLGRQKVVELGGEIELDALPGPRERDSPHQQHEQDEVGERGREIHDLQWEVAQRGSLLPTHSSFRVPRPLDFLPMLEQPAQGLQRPALSPLCPHHRAYQVLLIRTCLEVPVLSPAPG